MSGDGGGVGVGVAAAFMIAPAYLKGEKCGKVPAYTTREPKLKFC